MPVSNNNEQHLNIKVVCLIQNNFFNRQIFPQASKNRNSVQNEKFKYKDFLNQTWSMTDKRRSNLLIILEK